MRVFPTDGTADGLAVAAYTFLAKLFPRKLMNGVVFTSERISFPFVCAEDRRVSRQEMYLASGVLLETQRDNGTLGQA